MQVLIGCETSGTIRDAFIAKGHDAMSCDLLPTEKPGPHYQGDVLDILGEQWDLLIVHPDCTYLTASAAWAYGDGPYHQKVKPTTLVGAARREARRQSLAFVERIASASHIPKIAIENPATGFLNTMLDLKQYGFRSNFPTQVIHPHQYGHDASKATGLALKGLPDLVPTLHVMPRMVCCGTVLPGNVGKYGCPNCNGSKRALPRWGNQTDSGQNNVTPGPMRWLERARTYQGWADAMASQWGPLSTEEIDEGW